MTAATTNDQRVLRGAQAFWCRLISERAPADEIKAAADWLHALAQRPEKEKRA